MQEHIFLQGIRIIEVLINKELNDEQADLYRVLLDDIPDDRFIAGINVMLRERVYTNFPMPADIRRYCLETRAEDLEVRVAQGRNKLRKAINSVGTYNSVIFDDPVINMIVRDYGGWIKLGTMEYEEYEKFLKWEFTALYKAYAVRKSRDIPLILKGRNEDSIRYIGDEEKARKWIASYQSKISDESVPISPPNKNEESYRILPLLEGKIKVLNQ